MTREEPRAALDSVIVVSLCGDLPAPRGTRTLERGEETVELEPEGMLVVPPHTPHGFCNVGDVPLLVVSVHERGALRETWLGVDTA